MSSPAKTVKGTDAIIASKNPDSGSIVNPVENTTTSDADADSLTINLRAEKIPSLSSEVSHNSSESEPVRVPSSSESDNRMTKESDTKMTDSKELQKAKAFSMAKRAAGAAAKSERNAEGSPDANLPIETAASVKSKGGKILDSDFRIEEAVRAKLLEMNCGDLTEEELKKEIALVKRKRAQAKQKRIYVNVAFKMGAFMVMLVRGENYRTSLLESHCCRSTFVERIF
jgi:hypothetical protein